MARTLGLTKEKHELHDSIDEYSWIQKETRIRYERTLRFSPTSYADKSSCRTMSIMTLLDCAFCFFANYPCRIALSEMQYDLPCDEEIFACPHPFSEPGFHPSRHLTTLEAFQSLFGRGKSAVQSRHGNNDGNNDKSNPLELNVLDMFILIHRMLSYIRSLGLANLSSPLCSHTSTHNTILIVISSLLCLLDLRCQYHADKNGTYPLANPLARCSKQDLSTNLGIFGILQERVQLLAGYAVVNK